LNTPPPTHRSAELENRLLAFVSEKLACEVQQVTRGENAKDAIEFYDWEIQRIETLFREAEELQGRTRL